MFKFIKRSSKAASNANALALSALLTEAAATNAELNTDLVRTRGKLMAREYALGQIIGSVDSVKTPNGTLRKVRRIAEQGLGL